MARPRTEHPTPAELEILHVLWARGSGTVREIKEALEAKRPRAYTTVMSLVNLMADKGLLRCRRDGRAYVYTPRVRRETTLRHIVGDVVDRAFDGSAAALVARLLDHAAPDRKELDEIHRIIGRYRRNKTRGKP